MTTNAKGGNSLEEEPKFEGERKSVVPWTTYHRYWKQNHKHIKVNRPSEDICGLCYKFFNRHKFSVCTAILSETSGRSDGESSATTSTSDDETSDGENEERGSVVEEMSVPIGENIDIVAGEEANSEENESMELSLLRAAEHVKAARAQRQYFNDRREESKVEGTKRKVLVVDYGQNMEVPWFGGCQTGETYFYTPPTVANLGVVNCCDDVMQVHVYHEGDGKKGGNAVASLIMKSLNQLG